MEKSGEKFTVRNLLSVTRKSVNVYSQFFCVEVNIVSSQAARSQSNTALQRLNAE